MYATIMCLGKSEAALPPEESGIPAPDRRIGLELGKSMGSMGMLENMFAIPKR